MQLCISILFIVVFMWTHASAQVGQNVVLDFGRDRSDGLTSSAYYWQFGFPTSNVIVTSPGGSVVAYDRPRGPFDRPFSADSFVDFTSEVFGQWNVDYADFSDPSGIRQGESFSFSVDQFDESIFSDAEIVNPNQCDRFGNEETILLSIENGEPNDESGYVFRSRGGIGSVERVDSGSNIALTASLIDGVDEANLTISALTRRINPDISSTIDSAFESRVSFRSTDISPGIDLTITAVPEPTSMVGLVSLVTIAWTKRRQRSVRPAV